MLVVADLDVYTPGGYVGSFKIPIDFIKPVSFLEELGRVLCFFDILLEEESA